MKRQTALIFYVLSAYVVVQFIWWGFHLIELTRELNKESELIAKRVAMIFGEGAVFLLLLLIGIWQIRRSIKKELKLSERQKNFLLSITHELKTPLAANKLYIQTVTHRDLGKEQSNELLNKAIEENVRLEHMIDNVLNASRLENDSLIANKEKISLNEAINSSVERIRAVWKNADIVIDAEDGISLIADRLMIETIISNLLENAVKYTTNQPIVAYAKRVGDKVVFGVRDQGKGIPKEFKEEIFKKFYRIGNEDTRSQKGSGLGLFIVHQLVRLHGGSILCTDNVPNGTDFQIII